jgi:hypothetical protein
MSRLALAARRQRRTQHLRWRQRQQLHLTNQNQPCLHQLIRIQIRLRSQATAQYPRQRRWTHPAAHLLLGCPPLHQQARLGARTARAAVLSLKGQQRHQQTAAAGGKQGDAWLPYADAAYVTRRVLACSCEGCMNGEQILGCTRHLQACVCLGRLTLCVPASVQGWYICHSGGISHANARLRMLNGYKIGQLPLSVYILAVTELQAARGAGCGGAAVAVLPGGQAGGGAAVHGRMVARVPR